MQFIKRILLVLFTCTLFFSGELVIYAQTNTDALQNVQQVLGQKAKEKQSVHQAIQLIQHENDSLHIYISKNKKKMENTQQRMDATNQLIQKKKAEIVTLENKVLGRKAVMKQRLVALQGDNNLSLIIKFILDAKSLNDFLQRASAVSAIFSADENILGAQQEDLKQIEADKKEIDHEQQRLQQEQNVLAKQQKVLYQNLQKRQETLKTMQNKYNQIDQQMSSAQKQKEVITAQMKAAQAQILQEQNAAKNAVQSLTKNNAAGPSGSGKEIYVTATSYSPEESGAVTTLGYNIKNNPNLKLIAVDPSVIPLGKKVWVEGYGVAVAGDTGGAISGYRIDVLMPTKQAAALWGRRTVKVVVLN